LFSVVATHDLPFGKEQRLKATENKVERKTFKPKEDGVWRKLRNNKLHLYC
jgi:hypothetical protein